MQILTNHFSPYLHSMVKQTTLAHTVAGHGEYQELWNHIVTSAESLVTLLNDVTCEPHTG